MATDRDIFRTALHGGLPYETSTEGGFPEPSEFIAPARHGRAIDPDVPVVVGARGAGKSTWFRALLSPEYRANMSWAPGTQLDLASRALEAADVLPGFGTETSESYPGPDVIAQLMAAGVVSRSIWRTVVLRHLVTAATLPELPSSSWLESAEWVQANPELVDRAVAVADDTLRSGDKSIVVLFDALDRTADDWQRRHELLAALLKVLLDLSATKSIRGKAFVRPDMLSHPSVRSFPDAAKLSARTSNLEWGATDLYHLLWQRLANSPAGADFRQLTGLRTGVSWHEANAFGVFEPPAALAGDEKVQATLFHLIAGDWMGSDRRRGDTYTWLPKHLADANGQASPRSFLIALRKAIDDTQSRYYETPTALHINSIRVGVSAASTNRREEITEEIQWIDTAMAPLEGLTVPCEISALDAKWREAAVLGALGEMAGRGPQRLDEGFPGIRRELGELGILEEITGKRVNLPDIFRVAFRLKRKGGLKPLSSTSR
jgi:hypothetical protein